jgi:hypothetical protein
VAVAPFPLRSLEVERGAAGRLGGAGVRDFFFLAIASDASDLTAAG